MSDDESTPDKKVAYAKLGNLENVKRAFCNNEFDSFNKLVKEQKPSFKLFTAEYVDTYNEFQGKPDFILVNKGKGFVKVLEDFRNYLFTTFVCYKKDGKVVFKSYWIVNTAEDLKTVLEDEYDSFTFTPVNEADIDTFLDGFKTGGCDEHVSLNRLH